MLDTKAIAEATARIVREHVAAATAPLVARLADLEQQLASLSRPDPLEALDTGLKRLEEKFATTEKALRSVVTPELAKELDRRAAEVQASVSHLIACEVAGIRAPEDGHSPSPSELAPLIREEVAKAVQLMPAAKDGVGVADALIDRTGSLVLTFSDGSTRSLGGVVGKDADLAQVAQIVEEKVALLPPAEKTDLDESLVGSLVEAAVQRAIANPPLPKDGQSVAPEDLTPLVREEVARAVREFPVAKDGVGVAGALIDRTGALVLTLSDGSTKDLGVVVGKDVQSSEVERMVREQIALIPAPKDGRDGKDGFGLDDFDTEMQPDGRTVKFIFTSGDATEIHELSFPVMIYRGVFKEGEAYQRGDTVTWAGSLWHCEGDTSEKPGEGAKSWTLAVKRGRDGKDGSPGAKGEPGAKGKDGQDLTQLGPDGARW